MSVRTYNPSVLIGNWNEDICLEEDKLKDFLHKKENGELLIQKASSLLENILRQKELSVSYDGHLHFGDMVCLYNPSLDSMLSANMAESKMHEAKCIQGPCDVSAASGKMLQPCIRNIFVIQGTQPKMEGEVLKYEQPFYLSTLPSEGGSLKLMSDRVTFNKCAKKSRQQEVTLTEETSYMCCWKVTCFDPQFRLESEGMPVPANQRILVTHCKTGQNLAALKDFSFRTPFGREFEVTAHTYLDSHRAEMPPNHWVFLERHVDDAAAQQESERQAEFQDQIKRDQEMLTGGAVPPPVAPAGEQAPVREALPPDQAQTQ